MENPKNHIKSALPDLSGGAFTIEFLGVPSSGKTTIAARLFAELKSEGKVCELIVEQARRAIVDSKWALYDQWGEYPVNPVLSQEEQLKIFTKQVREELRTKTVSPGSIIVCDSSPLNTLFYLKRELWATARSLYEMELGENVDSISVELLKTQSKYPHVDLFVVCPILEEFAAGDPNRVHSKEQCEVLENMVPEILSEYGLTDRVLYLSGRIEDRVYTLKHLVNYAVGQGEGRGKEPRETREATWQETLSAFAKSDSRPLC